MISFTGQQTLYGKLSQNTTSDNLVLASQLSNIEHRYLLQKYFSNETSFNISTIGSQTLTLTAVVALGATSATLTSAWNFPSSEAVITFSDGEQRTAKFTSGSTAVTWQPSITGNTFYLTAALATSATSGTLAIAWAYTSGSYLVQFSDGEQKTVTLTSGATTITWTGGLTGPVGTGFRTSIITTSIGVGGVQTYRMPPDYSKIKTGTLTIGSLKWTPTEVLSREEWDNLNVFPYYADIPSHFFIWNNQMQFWPIPATTGNVVGFNYKRRVPDLSLSDYGGLTYTSLTGTLVSGNTITIGSTTALIVSFTSTNIAISNPSGTVSTGSFTTSNGATGTISAVATISVTSGSTTVTGTGTSFITTTNGVSESRWIQISQPTGDNLWYQIASVDSTTQVTLMTPYQGTTVTTYSAFTIGQMPLLMEDFHDMLVWKPLIFYYTSIVDNKGKREQYTALYNEKLELLAEYAGQKTINVNLSPRGRRMNPNLFPQNLNN